MTASSSSFGPRTPLSPSQMPMMQQSRLGSKIIWLRQLLWTRSSFKLTRITRVLCPSHTTISLPRSKILPSVACKWMLKPTRRSLSGWLPTHSSTESPSWIGIHRLSKFWLAFRLRLTRIVKHSVWTASVPLQMLYTTSITLSKLLISLLSLSQNQTPSRMLSRRRCKKRMRKWRRILSAMASIPRLSTPGSRTNHNRGMSFRRHRT